MARFYLFPLVALTFSSAMAADYETSPCVLPAEIEPYGNSAEYQSLETQVNKSIEDEIKESVQGELAVPLENYSAATPEGSRLYVGDVNISGGQVSVNGVDLDSSIATTPPPPCVIELKSAK